MTFKNGGKLKELYLFLYCFATFYCFYNVSVIIATSLLPEQ